MRDAQFLPANEAYRDNTRKELDHRVLIDMLGLPESILEPLDLLKLKWCSEPSVHGGKKTAPEGFVQGCPDDALVAVLWHARFSLLALGLKSNKCLKV